MIPFRNPHSTIRLLVIGAHPDDPDFCCGGTAIRFLNTGHDVMFASLTDGSAGHQQQRGKELARRRSEEAQNVARLLGLTYKILDNPDAGLKASIEVRNSVISLIRQYQPSLIVTHRPNDYHTDHRHASLLVQDAAYLVCVPNVCPEVPRLTYNPVIVYAEDSFQKPLPFQPDIIVDITEVYNRKLAALSCHESQLFEWLPYVENMEDAPPTDGEERLGWIDAHWGFRYDAKRYWSLLRGRLPESQLAGIRQVEAFEVCEYGGGLTAENADELFPFGMKNLGP
jgi:LmbE family N-acetylglucosaminyl deacetylase